MRAALRGILVAAVVSAVLPPTLAAQSVILDFDSISQDIVTDAYGSRGATFNMPARRDYSNTPGFAHSGSRAVELCFSVEFCTVPLRIDLSVAQARVKVWVGYAGQLVEPRTVVLQAFDQNNAMVGQTTALLMQSAAPTPVDIPLEIIAGAPVIRRMDVMIAGTGGSPGYNNGLVVDDVEFDAAGGPPPCNSPIPPDLILFEPSSGTAPNVSSNQFTLRGLVSTLAPLTAAEVDVIGSSGTTTASLLGTVIQPNGGAFGPTTMNGAMSPGGNAIIVRLRNCRGQTSDVGVMTFTPVSDQARVKVLGVEVTQATQDVSNRVPLVAGKTTVVRVYVALQGSTTPITQVSGVLTATRAGGGFVPPVLPSSNSITLTTGDELHSRRLDIASSLNFVLPADWIAPGTLHFQLSKLLVGGLERNFPCEGCGNTDAIGAPRWSHFNPVRQVNLVLAPYYYSNGLTPDYLFTPMGTLRWINNLYPLPGNYPYDNSGINVLRILPFQTVYGTLSPGNDEGSDFLDDLHALWNDLRILNQAIWPGDYNLLAITPCGCGGRAKTGKRVAYVDVYNLEAPTVVQPSQFEHYGQIWSHELGHNFGRKHASRAHGEDSFESFLESLFDSDVDPGFTLPHGGIGSIGFAANTFQWLGTPFVINPESPVTGQQHAHDIMSYGHTSAEHSRAWISPYTYEALFQKLLSTSQALAAPGVEREVLVVSGRIDSAGVMKLRPFHRVMTSLADASSGNGRLSVRLLDASGRTLSSHPVEIDRSDGQRSLSFRASIPWREGTREIVFVGPRGVMGKRAVSRNAPTVRIAQPANAGKGEARRVVTWEWRDADGDSLTADLFFRAGPSQAWLPLASGIKTNRAVVDDRLVPGSRQAQIRVRVSDGVHTAVADIEGVNIPDKMPEVSILTPQPGNVQNSVELIGTGYDAEDGMLADSSLTWTSSRDGMLGRGRRVIASKLSSGRHILTLTGTDSHGKKGTHRVTVTVGGREKSSR